MANLTARQLGAIEALMVSKTITDAAAVAGVGRRTLQTWLKDAQFCAELRSAQTRVLDHSVRRLTTLSTKAIDTLDESMDEEKPEVRVRAADIVLSRLMALSELHDIAERVKVLEEVQGKGSDES